MADELLGFARQRRIADSHHRLHPSEAQLEIIKDSSEATISFAVLTIKSFLLFNGGAIIGLLTLYGSLPTQNVNSGMFIDGIRLFVFGVSAGLCCALSAYLTQLYYTHASLIRMRLEYEKNQEQKARKKKKGNLKHLIGKVYHSVSITAGILSLVFFMGGTNVATCSLVPNSKLESFVCKKEVVDETGAKKRIRYE
jgi:hypothetical protein